jgi:hypothetical protein
MSVHDAGEDRHIVGPKPNEPASTDPPRTGLHDPRALDILTTEHWSLLSTRSLGYQEMVGRATIFVGVLSGTVIALALLAQATRFGRATLWFALLLISVALLIGVLTFVRCVAINYEDARWVAGMDRLRHAYLELIPELEPYFITGHDLAADRRSLAHGSPQHLLNLANSMTTTSSVVAALNSVLAGALGSAVTALLSPRPALIAGLGAGVSIVSAAVHVWYAAHFRRSHRP